MKKFLLSGVALLVLSASGFANAATVYSSDDASLDIIGRAKANVKNNQADDVHRLSTTARLGVKGKTKVNDTFSVFGSVLYDLSAQDSEVEDRFKIRSASIGFDASQFGTLSFGRFENAYYKTTAPTDLFTDYGNTGVTYWGISDNDYGGRMDGQALYEFSYEGFSLALSYNFKDSNKNIQSGYSGTLGYEFDIGGNPLGFLAGYNRINGNNEGYDAEGIYQGAGKTEFGASVYFGSYGAPGVYAAVVYNHGDLERTYRTDGVEAALAYTTPGGDWTFTGLYGYLKNQDQERSGEKDSRFSSAWTGNITWNLTSNFNIYTEYEHRAESILSEDAENLFTLGLIYNF